MPWVCWLPLTPSANSCSVPGEPLACLAGVDWWTAIGS